MTNKPNILKAEVLITRQCQLRCPGCKIPSTIPKEKELDVEQWKEVFDIVYNDLGAKFIAIYGGEPLMIEKYNLMEIIKDLSRYKDKGKSYTLISNCLGFYENNKLDENYMRELMNNGFDSLTASVDCIDEKNSLSKQSWLKSQKGLQTLLKFKEMGLRDCCGILTINRKNLLSLPKTINYLNENGIWAGMDFFHYQNCIGVGQKDLPLKSSLEGMIFTIKDKKDIEKISNELIKMKKNGGLIFPTIQTLQSWKKYAINLNWQCSSPICVSIDCDGSIRQCDSFKSEEMEKYNIFNVYEKWYEFKKDYIKGIKNENCRCFWQTHFFAEEMMKGENYKYYQHKTK